MPKSKEGLCSKCRKCECLEKGNYMQKGQLYAKGAILGKKKGTVSKSHSPDMTPLFHIYSTS